MKKTEKWLQSTIMRDWKREGAWIGHLSPPNHPGYPDLTVFHGKKTYLIEVKDFDQIGDGEKMIAVFQSSQPPFFLEMLRQGIDLEVIGLDHGSVLRIAMECKEKILNIFNFTKREYLDRYGRPY